MRKRIEIIRENARTFLSLTLVPNKGNNVGLFGWPAAALSHNFLMFFLLKPLSPLPPPPSPDQECLYRTYCRWGKWIGRGYLQVVFITFITYNTLRWNVVSEASDVFGSLCTITLNMFKRFPWFFLIYALYRVYCCTCRLSGASQKCWQRRRT